VNRKSLAAPQRCLAVRFKPKEPTMRKLLIAIAAALALAMMPTPTQAATLDIPYAIAANILYDRYCEALPQDVLRDTYLTASIMQPEELERGERDAHAVMARVGPTAFCAGIKTGNDPRLGNNLPDLW
jgi:hypothetical protein